MWRAPRNSAPPKLAPASDRCVDRLVSLATTFPKTARNNENRRRRPARGDADRVRQGPDSLLPQQSETPRCERDAAVGRRCPVSLDGALSPYLEWPTALGVAPGIGR